MARLLLTPRWLGRLAVLALVVVACWWLGSWQWDAAHTSVVRNPPAGTAPLVEVHQVGEPVDRDEAGRRVSLHGRFDPDRQVLVVDRSHDGRPGSWVVTAISVDGAEPGAVIPVLRGWLPEGDAPPPPPSGTQRIVGTLEPSEPDTLRNLEREPLADGQVEVISSPELLSLWRPPLLQGFIVQDGPEPAAPLEAVALPSEVEVETDWQNLAYAIQWWLFGAFAVFWFVRMMWVEAEDRAVGKMEADDDEPQPSREGSA